MSAAVLAKQHEIWNNDVQYIYHQTIINSFHNLAIQIEAPFCRWFPHQLSIGFRSRDVTGPLWAAFGRSPWEPPARRAERRQPWNKVVSRSDIREHAVKIIDINHVLEWLSMCFLTWYVTNMVMLYTLYAYHGLNTHASPSMYITICIYVYITIYTNNILFIYIYAHIS